MTWPTVPVVDLTPASVEVVTMAALPFVRHLQDQHRSEVGFLPTMALRGYQERRQLWLARENGAPCGYLAWGGFRRERPIRSPNTIKIIQACIDYDARRIAHATALVRNLEHVATMAAIRTVSLWCADDLPANAFWSALGYRCTATRTGGSGLIRNRQHRHWIINLTDRITTMAATRNGSLLAILPGQLPRHAPLL